MDGRRMRGGPIVGWDGVCLGSVGMAFIKNVRSNTFVLTAAEEEFMDLA
jgi:hypothetical protein